MIRGCAINLGAFLGVLPDFGVSFGLLPDFGVSFFGEICLCRNHADFWVLIWIFN